jgi:malate synthase
LWQCCTVTFNARRVELLAARKERQKRFDAGEIPGFLPETAAIRGADWQASPRRPPT